MKKFNILSFDGGGVRGVFAAQILSMLENELGFLSKVDFFFRDLHRSSYRIKFGSRLFSRANRYAISEVSSCFIPRAS